MKKVREFLKGKAARLAAVASVAAAALAGSACAEEAATGVVDTVSSSMTSSITDFAGKAATILGSIVAIAIPIAGAIWLATKAFGWFKKTSK